LREQPGDETAASANTIKRMAELFSNITEYTYTRTPNSQFSEI
jgi:hypothetical protein